MWIVAIGWMYVVTLMAATEPTVVGGIMTFFGYGVLPISLVFYLVGSRRRRGRAQQAGSRTANGAAIMAEAGAVPGAEGGRHAAVYGREGGHDGCGSADGGCAAR